MKAQAQAQARGITVASAHEAEDLMPLFRPRGNRTLTQGGNWMGADCATSFRLDNGTDPRLSDGEARLMWLFGDTFVGAFNATTPQRQLSGVSMPHQTLAILPVNSSDPQPTADDVRFYWAINETTHDPATIFVPTYNGAKTPCVTFPQTENNCELLWTMEGTRYQDAAVLSAAQIIISDDAPLGFDVLGTALIVLHNPDATGTPGDPALDPARGGAGQHATVPWEYDTAVLPWSSADVPYTSSAVVWSVTFDRANRNGRKVDAHDAAAVNSYQNSDSDIVYFMGSTQPSFDPPSNITLARAPLAELAKLDFNGTEFWAYESGGKGNATWCTNKTGKVRPQDLAPLFTMSSGLSEASLRWHSWLKRWYVPAITPEGDSLEVFFSHTEDITGPYEPLVVYKLPEPWGNMTDYYCYAGKAHPELERASNEMILSYVCNTMDPDALFQPGLRWADGYIPRFVRISFNETGKVQAVRPARH